MTDTHALPIGEQGTPRQLTMALCGAFVRIQDDAGWNATCPKCQAVLKQLEALEV